MKRKNGIFRAKPEHESIERNGGFSPKPEAREQNPNEEEANMWLKLVHTPTPWSPSKREFKEEREREKG